MGQEASSSNGVSVKVWKSKREYIAPDDFPETSLEDLLSKPNTAICFSGGGSRSMVSTIGFLAGLRDLNLLQNIRYIGGVNGGAIAAMMYCYSTLSEQDQTLLGPIYNPEDITIENLKEMDENCIRKFASMNFAYEGYIYGGYDRASSWANMVTEKILKPSGIEPGLLYTWNEASMDDVIKRNSTLARKDFQLPRKADIPYLVVGLSLVEPKKALFEPSSPRSPRASVEAVSSTNRYLEATPLYVGQMKSEYVTYRKKEMITGGMVEPLGFSVTGGKAPSKGISKNHSDQTLSISKPTRILDLATIACSTLLAPGELLEGDRLPEAMMDWTCDYWSPADDIPACTSSHLADGGNVMNIPLIPFIQRGVEKIIAVVNSYTPIDFADLHDYGKATNWKYSGVIRPTSIDAWLASLFGYLPVDTKAGDKYKDFTKNHIFASNQFDELVNGLYDCNEQDRCMIYRRKWRTVENRHYGIETDREVDVTFYYLAPCKSWRSKVSSTVEQYIAERKDLPVDIKSYDLPSPRKGSVVRRDSSARKDSMSSPRKDTTAYAPYSSPWSNKFPKEFEHFPNLSIHAAGYSRDEVNLLANMVGWTVLQSKEIFEAVLSMATNPDLVC